MDHQSSAARAVEGTHRFSFFAFEVAMSIPCGDLDVQHAVQSQRVGGWACPPLRLGLDRRMKGSCCMCFFLSSSKLPIQVNMMRSNESCCCYSSPATGFDLPRTRWSTKQPTHWPSKFEDFITLPFAQVLLRTSPKPPSCPLLFSSRFPLIFSNQTHLRMKHRTASVYAIIFF